MIYHARINVLQLVALSLAMMLGACSDRQEEAQAAFAEYQAAEVAGDLRATRLALSRLVSADDSNADYWIELGKVCMQMADYGAAYDAFQRAHELDRANAEVLAIMTQVALRSGNLAVAEENARQLELVAPSNPAVPLTKGYVALRRSDLVEAERQAAAFSQVAPYDSSGKILESRILMARNKPEEAIALLQEQLRQQPSDALSLRAIASLYELRERWSEAAAALRNYLNWQPNDAAALPRLIEFSLRAGQTDAAAAATIAGLEKGDVDALFVPWIALGQQNAIADRAFAWAQQASFGRRIAVARFLSTTDRPDRVMLLTQKEASVPVEPANIIPNALYGAALVQLGRVKEGQSRLDQVLKIDGTVREALRARALLRSRTGAHPSAIEDAQRLVAADRSSAPARVFLSRIYAAAGDQNAARRTLWDAFHDISGDRMIYDALRPLVARSDGPQAATRLSEEFYDQRNERITRSFA